MAHISRFTEEVVPVVQRVIGDGGESPASNDGSEFGELH
jgi:hypothetical protein